MMGKDPTPQEQQTAAVGLNNYQPPPVLELTGDDVEVRGLTVQLALLCALHSCNRELVPPTWQQVAHCVGHQLSIGDVAALGALAGGHVDDISL